MDYITCIDMDYFFHWNTKCLEDKVKDVFSDSSILNIVLVSAYILFLVAQYIQKICIELDTCDCLCQSIIITMGIFFYSIEYNIDSLCDKV